MKKIVSKFNSKNMANYMAMFAMIFTFIGANAKCTFIFHDPEKPDLTQFRKF